MTFPIFIVLFTEIKEREEKISGITTMFNRNNLYKIFIIYKRII